MELAMTALAAAGGPILKVLAVSSVGFVMSMEEVGLLHPVALSSLSKITTTVFLPAFLFSKLSANVNMERVIEWWALPFFVALNMLIGILLGRILVHFQGHRMGSNKGAVLASCTLGSVGHLPLVLAEAACGDGLPKFGQRQGVCENDAIAMVSFGLWIMTVTMWTFGGNLLGCFDSPSISCPSKLAYKRMEEKCDVEAPKEQSSWSLEPDATHNSPKLGLTHSANFDTVSTTAPAVIAADGRTGHHAPAQTTQDEVKSKEEKGNNKDEVETGARAAAQTWIRALTFFTGNPPVTAIFLGLLVGTAPALRALWVGHGAKLSLVRQTVEEVGGATVPCMLLVLGAGMRPRPSTPKSQTEGGGWQDVGGWPVLIAVTLIRLVLLPSIGVLLVRTADVASPGLLPSDPLLRFVIALQFSVPTAMNLQLVATVHGKGQAAITTLIIFQYIVAIPTLTLAMMYYLI